MAIPHHTPLPSSHSGPSGSVDAGSGSPSQAGGRLARMLYVLGSGSLLGVGGLGFLFLPHWLSQTIELRDLPSPTPAAAASAAQSPAARAAVLVSEAPAQPSETSSAAGQEITDLQTEIVQLLATADQLDLELARLESNFATQDRAADQPTEAAPSIAMPELLPPRTPGYLDDPVMAGRDLVLPSARTNTDGGTALPLADASAASVSDLAPLPAPLDDVHETELASVTNDVVLSGEAGFAAGQSIQIVSRPSLDASDAAGDAQSSASSNKLDIVAASKVDSVLPDDRRQDDPAPIGDRLLAPATLVALSDSETLSDVLSEAFPVQEHPESSDPPAPAASYPVEAPPPVMTEPEEQAPVRSDIIDDTAAAREPSERSAADAAADGYVDATAPERTGGTSATAPASTPPAPASDTVTPAASVVSHPTLSREEQLSLIGRAEEQLASGNVAAARLLYQQAALGGSGRAAAALSRTYAPDFLRGLGASEVPSDPLLALVWARRAETLGAAEPSPPATVPRPNAAPSAQAADPSSPPSAQPPVASLPQPQPQPQVQTPAVEQPASAENVAAASGRAAPPRPVPPPAGLERILARADEMMALRDVSAARRLYAYAAEAGNGQAAAALGRSYDPAYLQDIGAQGIRPDPVLAVRWYRQAIALGETQVAPLLARLQPR
ncbi:hypothetical protein [Teichococcus vastitatis]|uniref:Sel1 repeat-containing protein n=1 Tax=Teichococcus vastitatis TaxID=2307076 RepID=A0ABS9WE47_9PROT|nr:hypothetical protein [Pseudoroseomonas vastitatis]MCI0757150.1 hypothetical protein [Pseudoroseomonas vastitatis]